MPLKEQIEEIEKETVRLRSLVRLTNTAADIGLAVCGIGLIAAAINLIMLCGTT
jgi:hypothetical protein